MLNPKWYYRFLGTVATLGSFLFSFFLTSCHQRRHQCLATTASGLNGDNGRVDVVALAVRRRDESGWRKARREWLERGGGCGDQSALLYGSEMWVLSTASLARLERFHLCAAYRMAKKHVPRRGPHQQWVYPPSDKVLEECGMHTIDHYIDVQRETIVRYMVDRSILAECQGADRRSSLMPRQWWWEQRMCLDDV